MAIVVSLLFLVVLGCDPYEADIWLGILAMYGVCWLAFSALSCLVEDAKCILGKDRIRFRKALGFYHKYTIKGWAMDDERLKNGGSVLTTEYFDRLLEQIREIRLSERRFYQKITDIISLG